MAPSYAQWLSNIREVVSAIADREMQKRRWLATDAYAWERPEELINEVDDVVFDGFLDQFSSAWTPEQAEAARNFRVSLDDFCKDTPERLNPAEVLKDPAWERVRSSADRFLLLFPEVTG